MVDNPDIVTTYKTYTYQNGRMATQKVYDGVTKYYGKLLREEIHYAPTFGFAEFGMTRYEYEKK